MGGVGDGRGVGQSCCSFPVQRQCPWRGGGDEMSISKHVYVMKMMYICVIKFMHTYDICNVCVMRHATMTSNTHHTHKKHTIHKTHLGLALCALDVNSPDTGCIASLSSCTSCSAAVLSDSSAATCCCKACGGGGM